ncbi:MAG: hypothetical protein WBS54_15890 [Acidobacteriota bacterium]
MTRRLVALVLVITLAAALVPVPAPAQWAVAVVADPANWPNWMQEFTEWTSQLSYMLQQYQQLQQTYQWAQHVAENLKHPTLYTVLPLFATVDSGTLTKIDSVEGLRHMLEGSQNYSASTLGQLYAGVYGAALDLQNLSPHNPQDWAGAVQRLNATIQQADASILEAMATVSKVNGSLTTINQTGGTYAQLRQKIQDTSATPHQTEQAGAMASLYAAQAVDKNTQVLSAVAAMQAQQMAQEEATVKAGALQTSRENQYIQDCIQYATEHPDNPTWHGNN